MSKFQLMLTSLIAVVPGAFLIYLLVMAMLFTEGIPTMAYAAMGGTLLASAITVLIPAGVLVSGGRKSPRVKPAKDKKDKKAAKKGKDQDTGGDIEAVASDAAVIVDAVIDDEAIEEAVEAPSESFSDANLDSMGEPSLEIGESEFDLGSTFDSIHEVPDDADVDTEPVEDFDSLQLDDEEIGTSELAVEDADIEFSFDDDIEEDEPKPKKKKG